MGYEFSGHSSSSYQRPGRWLERLLLLGFLVSLSIGLAALVLFWIVRDSAPPDLNADPLRAVRTEEIVPQVALRELGGDPVAGLALQSLQAGHLETARAFLVFAGDAMKPVEWAAWLASLGQAYLAVDEPAAAGQIYVQVFAAALLHDAIPLLERVSLLTQSVAGLQAAGYPAAALEAATQATRLAVQAPELLPAQRSALFAGLRTQIEAGAERSEASTALAELLDDYVRNPYLNGAGSLITPTLAALPQPIAYDSATQEKIVLRQQAADILADRIVLTEGGDIEPERAALAEALRAEDQARSQFYTAPGEMTRGQQLWLLLDRRGWLITQIRVAVGGYGLALVPDWEAELEPLLGELNQVHHFLRTVLMAYANEQPTAQAGALLQVEIQHWLALQALRGLYPGAPLDEIGEVLRSQQNELQRLGQPLALPLLYESGATPPGFRIQALP